MKKPPNKPSILIDASDIDKPSGGRTAVFELFKEVFRLEPDWRFIILLSRREPDFDGFTSVKQIIIPFRNRILERISIQTVASFFSLIRKVDLVHFSRTMGGFAWPAKSVLTIFDLTTLRYPELHSRWAVWYWKYIQPTFIRRADRIIAISTYVADNLNHYYNLTREKIKVIYCAPKSIFYHPEHQVSQEILKKKYSLPEKYLLFIGILARKKNLTTLLKAIEILTYQRPDFPPLVIAGRRYPQSDDENSFNQIKKMGIEPYIRYIGPVLDEELPALYRGADIFIFPSIDEGFGIPCLEAMICGVPVIAAKSGAIPEITGDAAFLLEEPKNAKKLAELIFALVSDRSCRDRLITKGKIRGGDFSWTEQALRLTRLYRELLT